MRWFMGITGTSWVPWNCMGPQTPWLTWTGQGEATVEQRQGRGVGGAAGAKRECSVGGCQVFLRQGTRQVKMRLCHRTINGETLLLRDISIAPHALWTLHWKLSVFSNEIHKHRNPIIDQLLSFYASYEWLREQRTALITMVVPVVYLMAFLSLVLRKQQCR